VAAPQTLEQAGIFGRAVRFIGAGAIVMGCAGMARLRTPLEDALGIPVIDPTQAAATMALGSVQFSRH
jgi:allantoin racemase